MNGAREHYRILQGAWNHNQLETIREYVSPSLFEDLKAERANYEGDQHTDVMYVDAEIVRADYDANRAQLSSACSSAVVIVTLSKVLKKHRGRMALRT